MLDLKYKVSKRAKEKNIPLCQLEEAAGLAKGSISKWNAVSPSVDKVIKVATVLGCDVGDLLSATI